MGRLPWWRLVIVSLLGTLAAVVVVVWDVDRRGGNPVSLVQPGLRGPSTAVFREDFPEAELPSGTGHDGQQFYAIARAPMHLDEVAEHLDRPHYRLQRPLFPWLAWLLHPSGGGLGLVRAMFAVGVASLVAGGVATGALAVARGGAPWVAGLFAVLPGSYLSLRIGVGDSLAVALAVGAIALSLRERHWPAIGAAVAAVLAKEPVLLVLAGYGLWRRDRRGFALVAIPAGVAAVWAVVLRLAVESSGPQIREFRVPLVGLARAWSRHWSDGDEMWALGSVAVAVILGALALWRGGMRSPLGWPIALHLAFIAILSVDVIGLDLNAPRAVLPLYALSLAELARTIVRQPKAATAEPVTSRATG